MLRAYPSDRRLAARSFKQSSIRFLFSEPFWVLLVGVYCITKTRGYSTGLPRDVNASADDRYYHGEQHRKLLFFIVYPSDRHTPCCHTMLTNRCGANVHWLTESNGLYDTLSNTSGVELGIIALGAHDPSPADLENVLGSWLLAIASRAISKSCWERIPGKLTRIRMG